MAKDVELFNRSFEERFVNHRFIFFPADVADEKIFKKTKEEASFNISKGCSYLDLCTILVEFGYLEVDFVEEPFTFTRRGMVVDFFPQSYSSPIRVLFDGDICSSLYVFNKKTQLTAKSIPFYKIIKSEQEDILVSFNDACFGLGFEKIYSSNNGIYNGNKNKVKEIFFPENLRT